MTEPDRDAQSHRAIHKHTDIESERERERERGNFFNVEHIKQIKAL